MSKNILVLPGDGIGPEIVTEAVKVIARLRDDFGLDVEMDEALVGGAAYDAAGHPLPAATLDLAKEADAVLLGAVGGPKWEPLDIAVRPEKGLLGLRSELGLFANLRPAILYPQLAAASTLRPEVVSGLDIMIVRELTGGIYFGKPRGVTTLESGERQGVNTFVYRESEIERIVRVALLQPFILLPGGGSLGCLRHDRPWPRICLRSAERKSFRSTVPPRKEPDGGSADLKKFFGGSMSFTIYPAIDLLAGRVVRLQEGDPARMTAYGDDPAGTARRWLDAGAKWLHVVNLDGAFGESDGTNQQALREILKLPAHVQFVGGIRSVDAVERVLNLGVSRVIRGTIAIEQPSLVASALQSFGAEKIVVGIDARDGLVRIRGWQENSGMTAMNLALLMKAMGLRTVIFTDVSRDGLGRGLNIPSTRGLADASGLDGIASGGVHTLEDVRAAHQADLAGVIIGRALYEGAIDLQEALGI